MGPKAKGGMRRLRNSGSGGHGRTARGWRRKVVPSLGDTLHSSAYMLRIILKMSRASLPVSSHNFAIIAAGFLAATGVFGTLWFQTERAHDQFQRAVETRATWTRFAPPIEITLRQKLQTLGHSGQLQLSCGRQHLYRQAKAFKVGI